MWLVDPGEVNEQAPWTFGTRTIAAEDIDSLFTHRGRRLGASDASERVERRCGTGGPH